MCHFVLQRVEIPSYRYFKLLLSWFWKAIIFYNLSCIPVQLSVLISKFEGLYNFTFNVSKYLMGRKLCSSYALRRLCDRAASGMVVSTFSPSTTIIWVSVRSRAAWSTKWILDSQSSFTQRYLVSKGRVR